VTVGSTRAGVAVASVSIRTFVEHRSVGAEKAVVGAFDNAAARRNYGRHRNDDDRTDDTRRRPRHWNTIVLT
jgi:hypothetical protein